MKSFGEWRAAGSIGKRNNGVGAADLKKIIVLFFLFLIGAGICFAADPAEGFWLSVDEKTHEVTAGWHIYQEGTTLLGKMMSMSAYPKTMRAGRCKDSYPGFPIAGKVNQLFVIGTPWIFGLSSEKTGEWSGGYVINPEDGKIYKCKIIYRAADGKKYKTDVLEMRGEIGLGIGRSQFWQKSDSETAGSLGPQ